MRSIIEKIYYGEIYPSEKYYNESCDYNKYRRIYLDYEKLLNDFFEKNNYKEQAEMLEKLIDARGTMNDYDCYDNFENGFTLGAKLVIEILKSSDEYCFKKC